MSNKGFDIIVLGGANWDYLVRGPKLPLPGETVDGEEFHEGPGGKGANQAVAVARLGCRIALIARIGKDPNGDRALKNLISEGVDARLVVQDERAVTGVALIGVGPGGQKQILVAPGANRRLSVSDIRAAAAAISKAKVLLSQLEVPLEVVVAAARLARSSGVKMVLDPAPAAPLPDELLSLLHVIRPNAVEAETLTGIKVTDRKSAKKAADQLLGRGVGAVAVQAGDEGNLLVWPEHECFLPKLRVKSVDATGAGDAFAAALAVCVAENRSWEEAGRFANAAAAIATTAVGAQAGLPRREEILELLEST